MSNPPPVDGSQGVAPEGADRSGRDIERRATGSGLNTRGGLETVRGRVVPRSVPRCAATVLAPGFFTRALCWIGEHPTRVALALGAAAVIGYAFAPEHDRR